VLTSAKAKIKQKDLIEAKLNTKPAEQKRKVSEKEDYSEQSVFPLEGMKK